METDARADVGEAGERRGGGLTTDAFGEADKRTKTDARPAVAEAGRRGGGRQRIGSG